MLSVIFIRPAGCPSCVAETLMLHIMLILSGNVFMPAGLIGIIGFYHFIKLSVPLTVARGHKVCRKQNLLA